MAGATPGWLEGTRSRGREGKQQPNSKPRSPVLAQGGPWSQAHFTDASGSEQSLRLEVST
jgi:hypothetical protein